MNKKRRAQLNRIVTQLKDALELLEADPEAERDCLDAMPDSLRDGSKGEQVEEWLETLKAAAENLQESIEQLEEVGGE